MLQSKAEGLNAYEKYTRDAEAAGSTACVEMFHRLHESDAKQLREVKDHVFGMIARDHGRSGS